VCRGDGGWSSCTLTTNTGYKKKKKEKKKKEEKKKKGHSCMPRTFSPTPLAIEISTPWEIITVGPFPLL